jgi:membrane-associated phospholipid phosphatase
MRFLTDFADQAVLLPLALAVTLVLAVTGWRRAAWVWTLMIVAGFAAVLALKLFGYCTPLPAVFDIRSPSGHTAGAAMVYGGLAALLPIAVRARVLIAVLVALAVGVSRLALGMHTPAEVVLGGLLGVVAVAAFCRLIGPPPTGFAVWRGLALALLVGVLFHGHHIAAETPIRDAAHRWAVCVPDQARP